jgi:hypothetical protein
MFSLDSASERRSHAGSSLELLSYMVSGYIVQEHVVYGSHCTNHGDWKKHFFKVKGNE